MRGLRAGVIALAALSASACNTIDDNHLTSRDWAERGVKREARPDGFWCYRTLGRPDCSVTPRPGQEHRLIQGGRQPAEAAPFPPPKTEPAPPAGRQSASARPAPSEPSFGERLENLFGL